MNVRLCMIGCWPWNILESLARISAKNLECKPLGWSSLPVVPRWTKQIERNWWSSQSYLDPTWAKHREFELFHEFWRLDVHHSHNLMCCQHARRTNKKEEKGFEINLVSFFSFVFGNPKKNMIGKRTKQQEQKYHWVKRNTSVSFCYEAWIRSIGTACAK